MLLQLGLLVLLTTVACELAAKRGWIPYWVSRKILHVVAVGSCAVAGYYADTLGHRTLLTWIVAGAEVALLALVGTGVLMREESGRPAWGIVWFPLAFLILLLSWQSAEMVGFCMAVLAVCDPAATVAGKVFGNPRASINAENDDTLDKVLIHGAKVEGLRPTSERSSAANEHSGGRPQAWYSYNLTGDPKTLFGSIAFFISFLFLSHLFPDFLYDNTSFEHLIFIGIVLSAVEAVGSKGLDNLLVPLFTYFLLIYTGYWPDFFPGTYLMVYTALSALFIVITVRRKSLSPGGALTAVLLGLVIAYSAGPTYLLPLFVFFLSSSLIGRLLPVQSSAGDDKQKQPRDAIQVLANGAIYGALALMVTQVRGEPYVFAGLNHPISPLLLTAAAAATADTWSSEIGQYFRRPTFDLLKWRRVPPGLSGGVSLPGTLAGLAGAALIAALGWWLLEKPSWTDFALITAFGFAGMLLDSVLGSLLQATYRNPATGALSDTRPADGELAAGFTWMTNDLVNFLAILVTVVFAAVCIG